MRIIDAIITIEMIFMKEIMIEICAELNIKCTFFSEDWCCLLEKDSVSHIVSGYKFPLNDHASGLVADDKYALYELLKLKKIPVIEHKILFRSNQQNNLDVAYDYLIQNNNVLVVKPNNGTCGNGVARVYTKEELSKHMNKLFIDNFSISICPYYDIKTEYRTIILNGKVECMYGKKIPVIYGDGKSTIKELLKKFNPQFFTDDTKFFNKKINIESIPGLNERVEYNWQFNLAKGSQVIENISSEKRKIILDLALRAYNASGLKFCSVDVVEVNNQFLVLEINSGVTIKRYIDLIPDGYNIAKEIYKDAIKEMFKL